jgi:hypothetical protein
VAVASGAAGPSVPAGKPAASGPKHPKDSGTLRKQSRACAAFSSCPVDRSRSWSKLCPRRDGNLTKRTLELDPGLSLWSPRLRRRLLPSLDLSRYYELLVLPEARGIGRPGLLHPLNVTRASCGLTCSPRATGLTGDSRYTVMNEERAKPAPCCVVLPPQCLSWLSTELTTGHALHRQASRSGDWRRLVTAVSVLPRWRFAGSLGVNGPFLSLELLNAGIGGGN